MKKFIKWILFIAVIFLSGCASVPMESIQATNNAKEFKLPDRENAGVYVYRDDSSFGAALKKSV